MSKETIVKCDRCGVKVVYGEHSEVEMRAMTTFGRTEKWDLCRHCVPKLREFIYALHGESVRLPEGA